MNVTRAALTATLLATLMPGRGEAAPVACVPGTLSDYFALSDACTVGAFQFQNFVQLTTQPAGSSPISPDAVQVMPVASGLAFGVDVSASAGELLEILFGYDVTGSGIAGAGLSLSGASAAGDGAVTAEVPFGIIPRPPSAGRGVVAPVAVLSGGLVRAVDGLSWTCRRRMRSGAST